MRKRDCIKHRDKIEQRQQLEIFLKCAEEPQSTYVLWGSSTHKQRTVDELYCIRNSILYLWYIQIRYRTDLEQHYLDFIKWIFDSNSSQFIRWLLQIIRQPFCFLHFADKICRIHSPRPIMVSLSKFLLRNTNHGEMLPLFYLTSMVAS